MNLSEYLKLKGLSPSLTGNEARAIGVPFPLVRGWVTAYATIEVPEKIVAAVHLSRDQRKKVANEVRREKKEKKAPKPCFALPVQPKKVKKTKPKKHVDYAWVNSDDFLRSFQWRQVRMVVLKRDGRKCACCNATAADGVRIHVDHIKPRRKYPELALDEDNLQVLCEECNHGKGSWDETDWREVADEPLPPFLAEHISQY